MKKFLCLAVALGITSSFAAGQVQALATWIGSWDYVLRHDQDGKPQAAFARLRGDNEALLWLTCSRMPVGEDLPEVVSMTAAVSQKSYLGPSAPRGRSTIYWFDDGSPELSYWVYRGRVGRLANSEQVSLFLKKLSGARSLVIELSNYRYETQRSEFQLNAADTKAVAERFRQDCRDIAGRVSADQSLIH
ncbi:hypothetical protein DC522_18830 [Microvirga sp. KLBC 81]|nr:hypothetical protein DC522_18830 [Microvirga sp. KLBC 81]